MNSLRPSAKVMSRPLPLRLGSHSRATACVSDAGQITVAKDKIVFNMAELTGNVWILEPIDQQ